MAGGAGADAGAGRVRVGVGGGDGRQPGDRPGRAGGRDKVGGGGRPPANDRAAGGDAGPGAGAGYGIGHVRAGDLLRSGEDEHRTGTHGGPGRGMGSLRRRSGLHVPPAAGDQVRRRARNHFGGCDLLHRAGAVAVDGVADFGGVPGGYRRGAGVSRGGDGRGGRAERAGRADGADRASATGGGVPVQADPPGVVRGGQRRSGRVRVVQGPQRERAVPAVALAGARGNHPGAQ